MNTSESVSFCEYLTFQPFSCTYVYMVNCFSFANKDLIIVYTSRTTLIIVSRTPRPIHYPPKRPYKICRKLL